MLHTYKPLPTGPVLERAGTAWVECDADDCTNTAQVAGVTVDLEPLEERIVVTPAAAMPDGWVTSNVYNNAVAGAAQFCPEHAAMVATPET